MNWVELRVIPESLAELMASGIAAVYCLSGSASSAMDEFCCADDLVCRTLVVSIAGDDRAGLFEGLASAGTEVEANDGVEGVSRERVCFGTGSVGYVLVCDFDMDFETEIEASAWVPIADEFHLDKEGASA
jgi:hypothetical protein